MKADCKNCIHRCINKEQYLDRPYKNMYGDKVDFNCLVLDDELEVMLHRNCDELEEMKEVSK